MAERVIFEVNGQRFVADTTAGPGPCRECEMPRRGKTCVWSMVCANVLGGACFKRVKTESRPDGKTAGNDGKAKADAMAEIYKTGKYSGD